MTLRLAADSLEVEAGPPAASLKDLSAAGTPFELELESVQEQLEAVAELRFPANCFRQVGGRFDLRRILIWRQDRQCRTRRPLQLVRDVSRAEGHKPEGVVEQ